MKGRRVIQPVGALAFPGVSSSFGRLVGLALAADTFSRFVLVARRLRWRTVASLRGIEVSNPAVVATHDSPGSLVFSVTKFCLPDGRLKVW